MAPEWHWDIHFMCVFGRPTWSASHGSAACITAAPGARRRRSFRAGGFSGPRRRKHRRNVVVRPRSDGAVHSRGWDHERGTFPGVSTLPHPASDAVLFTDRVLEPQAASASGAKPWHPTASLSENLLTILGRTGLDGRKRGSWSNSFPSKLSRPAFPA